ncbi:hypothetical protein [Martelella radicis]|uniref:Uncharacterized protein n=1 Tax=Martelella radicis TaxID=1397476 RepID=A0A7W6KJQ7_9HYPH|nr:hypothetical protein [Martelella radicis]MBB4122556.1 hypothetical protein [Martelella radicis]
MIRRFLMVLPAIVLLVAAGLLGRFLVLPPDNSEVPAEGPVTGIVWQVDDATARPEGNWQRLGADHLLIQWIVVDDIGFARGLGKKRPTRLPDWQRIGAEPWARHVTLGLAGDFAEKKARADVLQLARASAAIAGKQLPLDIEGYYFPVEVDPTWQEAAKVMPEALSLLPRPLWISVYDNSDMGGAALADWLSTWLPEDVGIFFQDGVGVDARSAQTARDYADALAARFGKDRLRVITEAFRPLKGGGFRAATAAEIEPQIRALRGYDIYLFDGPHYLNDALVKALSRSFAEEE